jgi:hypothetical protein
MSASAGGAAPMLAPQSSESGTMAATQPRRSRGQIIAGVLADGFAGAAGRPPMVAQMWARERDAAREAEREQVRWNRQRQGERDEWTWRENWKRQNPDDRFTQYMQAAGIDPASPKGQALYRQRAESIAAPPMMAVDGFDPQGNPTKTFMPRTGVGGGQPQASGPAVGTVRNGFRFNGGNPNDRSSWVPIGGAPPQGGASFPVR